jgi:radical SAM superfamily enzyme YgiQ (UPF0313 family)
MKVTLIKPGMGQVIDGYNINDGRMEPLQLGILAGLCPPDVEVNLFDDRMEKIPFDAPTDLVAITVDSFNARRAYEIASEFRRRNIQVVLGGVHVSLLPDEASRYADAIVVGDAETVWKQILVDAKAHQLQSRYTGTFGTPQEGVYPRRNLFKGKGYLPVSLIQFSRGCQFNCSFCSVSRFFKQSYTCRKIDDVLAEIEKDKLKTLLFVDDNMVMNRTYLKDFLRELIPMKVRWASQSSIDMTNDKELMELMARSGCVGNLIGFESIDVQTLKWFNKAPNLRQNDKYKASIEVFRDYGMLTWASFMVGNDFDDLDSIKRTVDYAIASKFTLAFFHILMPYPGTKIFDQFNEENRLLYDGHWWNHPDYRYNAATFIPKKITPEQLSEAVIQANKDFYSVQSITKRAFDFKTNMRDPIKLLIYSRLNHVLRSTSI